MVLRQLSPMQKGIQSLHAVVNYSQHIKILEKYGDRPELCQVYNEWADIDKTMIILDGGTSKELLETLYSLQNYNIYVSDFNECDLDDITTAFCFIVDERVWNAVKYPSYNSYALRLVGDMNSDQIFEQYVNEIWNGEPFKEYLELRDLIFSKKLSL